MVGPRLALVRAASTLLLPRLAGLLTHALFG